MLSGGAINLGKTKTEQSSKEIRCNRYLKEKRSDT